MPRYHSYIMHLMKKAPDVLKRIAAELAPRTLDIRERMGC